MNCFLHHFLLLKFQFYIRIFKKHTKKKNTYDDQEVLVEHLELLFSLILYKWKKQTLYCAPSYVKEIISQINKNKLSNIFLSRCRSCEPSNSKCCNPAWKVGSLLCSILQFTIKRSNAKWRRVRPASLWWFIIMAQRTSYVRKRKNWKNIC